MRPDATTQVSGRLGVVVEPGMYGRSLHGNREISGLTTRPLGWSASGRRGAEADDERAGEVRPLYSSEEAGEQPRTIGCGVGGAKGGGQGQLASATHAPDAEPGQCVFAAAPRTTASKPREQGAVHRSAASYKGQFTPDCVPIS